MCDKSTLLLRLYVKENSHVSFCYCKMAYRIVLLNVNRTKKATELFILTYMEEEI